MKMIIKFSHLNWIRSINKINSIALILILFIVGCKKEDDESLVNDTGLCLVEIDGNFEEIELDEVPEYLNGGKEGFLNAIYEDIVYPAEARENGIEGLCVVNYEIAVNGAVENIKAIQDPGGRIGDSTIETIELITQGVSFSPGILNGNPVRVKKELELRFKLE